MALQIWKAAAPSHQNLTEATLDFVVKGRPVFDKEKAKMKYDNIGPGFVKLDF